MYWNGRIYVEVDELMKDLMGLILLLIIVRFLLMLSGDVWIKPVHCLTKCLRKMTKCNNFGAYENGRVEEAIWYFERNPFQNLISWTAATSGTCGALGDIGLGMTILGLIVKVGFGNHVSVLNSLITLNLRLGEVDLARKIFDQMQERDVVSWTAILYVHVELGNLRETQRIFDMMPERNEVSWSAMIAR
ncbi:Pentatricopeptide repeat [Dillenia turbinata]|uniref:Pentatricopeptide repeat n=1 Tax=Dillenia turbinata TaxID=194707 RepID=A0AAN8UY56_9MAGN